MMSNPFLIRFYDIFITILSHIKTNFIFNPPLPTFTFFAFRFFVFSLFRLFAFRFSLFAFSKFKASRTERFFPASRCVPAQGELISQCAAIWIPVPPDVNTPAYSTRSTRQVHACEASRSAHYAVASQTHT